MALLDFSRSVTKEKYIKNINFYENLRTIVFFRTLVLALECYYGDNEKHKHL